MKKPIATLCLLCVSCLALVLAAWPGMAPGALTSTPFSQVWETDGTVSATTLATAPAITDFSPTWGPVGTDVILEGTNEGTDFFGVTAVTFNGASSHNWTIWTASGPSGTLVTRIRATVPHDASSGPIAVIIPSGTITSDTSFTVGTVPPPPSITKLKPGSASRGALVTISGTDFGAARGTSAVKFGSKACTKYVSWSATKIKCRVPMKAKYGVLKVTVTTTAGKSNTMSFTVKR